MEDILSSIKQINFGDGQYYKTTYEKTQIVLHHTVSNGSAQAVADYWKSKDYRIGTCIIIDLDGVIHQLFSSRFYAGHIGNVANEMKSLNLPYRSCSKNSIGVEIISLGGLKKKSDNKLYDVYGREFTGDSVYYENGYRGYEYFHKYNDKQIASLKKLLIYWCNRYDIPTIYNEDIWDTSKRALSGERGIFSHTSYRDDKSDMHPQIELINMLKSL